MSETYEEIVRKWYLKMRPQFTDLLLQRYRGTSLRLADAENIYQDVFLAIHRNLAEGRIKENTSWASYILTVGLNMASKNYRLLARHSSIDEGEDDGEAQLSERARRARHALELVTSVSGESEVLAADPDAQEILSEELNHLPHPCDEIIRLKYIEGLKDKEIATIIPDYASNGKSAEVNAKAIKARRTLCMRDLIYRVKNALFLAGIIDNQPQKQSRK